MIDQPGSSNSIPEETANELAVRYRTAVNASLASGLAAEPEAQLTGPTDRLIVDLAEITDIGSVQMVREQQLQGSRPDFGVICDGRFCGWVELKKPETAIDDPSSWTGHNGRQWQHLSQLDNLLLTNGREMRWFRLGEQVDVAAALPYSATDWDPGPAVKLLRGFAEGRIAPVTAVNVLARRLAPLARDLRDSLLFQRSNKSAPGYVAARNAHDAWKGLLKEDASDAEFADSVAQVVAYGLVIAALEGEADIDGDGVITLEEARTALHGHHSLLSAALAPILGMEGFLSVIQVEVAAIERLVSGVNAEAIRKRKDPRGEPWLWFYEDFLAAYDPEARQRAGVYYTPIEVVDCITRLVDDVIVNRFGKPLGFGDSSVTTLDPACGTGTFPLAVIDRAADRAVAERGQAGPSMAATTLGTTLFGFELLPGPYAVAHLRISERLRQLGGKPQDAGVNILLADTLASPYSEANTQPQLWGDAAILAAERQRAQEVKRDQPVMVVLGNPPYSRVDRESAGGWVVHGDSKTPSEKALFAQVVDRANAHTIFSHRRSLYNLYSYFWRWAIWKAFEAQGPGPAVVAFITGSSWLGGPGFIGLRELALKHADEILVIDLGGDNKGGVKDENVFAIESPVAITVLVRDGKTDGRKKARVRFQRITGTGKEKRAQLETILNIAGTSWEDVALDDDKSFVPPHGGADWHAMPAITDLLPWQQPGCIVSRLWPVAPTRDVLEKRWQHLLESPSPSERALRFATAKTGRNIHSIVNGLPRIADLPPGSPTPPITRYAWRSFDRQWIIEDARVAKTEGPSLWASRSQRQIFLCVPSQESIGPGPTATVSVDVPDFHSVRGSAGGKDVLPLFRDSAAMSPNVTGGLLDALQTSYEFEEAITPEDLAAYLYGLLSSPRFQQRFATELQTPGVRVPITASGELWKRVVSKGQELLWLHTYAERYRSTELGRGQRVPKVEGIQWVKAVTSIPEDMKKVKYAVSTETLFIGDGELGGVSQAVWEFSVSGMAVLKKWLGARTEKGIGRAASQPKPLDRIRPSTWADEWNDELLDLVRILTLTVNQWGEQAELVDAVCDGRLIPRTGLPVPTADEHKVPKVTPQHQARLVLE